MKLRFFQVYDEHDECLHDPVLQYWDNEQGMWLDIPSVRVPSKNEYDALIDEEWC